jgi:hypothetical protein
MRSSFYIVAAGLIAVGCASSPKVTQVPQTQETLPAVVAPGGNPDATRDISAPSTSTVVAVSPASSVAKKSLPENTSTPPPAVVLTPATTSQSAWRSVINTVFSPGERFDYVITWGIVKAGTSYLAIDREEIINGRSTWVLKSEAFSAGMVDGFYKVRDKHQTWIDQQALSTVRVERNIREGKYRMDEVMTVDQEAHKAHLIRKRLDKEGGTDVTIDVPPNVLDVFGGLYYTRLLPLEVGKEYSFDVTSGKKVYPLLVKVLKRETVKVPAGKFDCFKVQPVLREPGMFVSKGKKMEVWITADDRRIPVLMRSEIFIGSVDAELTKFVVSPPKQ